MKTLLIGAMAKPGWLALFIVAPGKTSKLGAYLNSRGRYVYKVDNALEDCSQVP